MKRKFFACLNGKFKIGGYEYRKEENNGIPVIISHGFLANQKRLKPYAEYLANRGYVVFTYDFCGGGLMSKSDGKFCDMSLNTEKQDLLCVMDYVKGLNYVDSDKLILFGESQGGVVSCMVAAEHKIDRLILLYPALCIPDDARKGKMLFMHFDPDNIDGTLKCKPFLFSPEYPKSAIGLDMYEILGNITAPILIIHGSQDGIVDIAYAKRAKETAVNEKSRLAIIDGAKHGFNRRQVKIANGHIKEFLQGIEQ